MSRIQFASIKGQDSSFTFSKKVKMVVPYCAAYYSAYFNRKKIIFCCTCTCTISWPISGHNLGKLHVFSLLHLLEKQRYNFQVTVPVIFSSLHMWKQLVKNFSYIVTDFLFQCRYWVLNRENREPLDGLYFSVADPGCLSRIRIFSIPGPGSKRLRIPDPDPHQRI